MYIALHKIYNCSYRSVVHTVSNRRVSSGHSWIHTVYTDSFPEGFFAVADDLHRLRWNIYIYTTINEHDKFDVEKTVHSTSQHKATETNEERPEPTSTT